MACWTIKSSTILACPCRNFPCRSAKCSLRNFVGIIGYYIRSKKIFRLVEWLWIISQRGRNGPVLLSALLPLINRYSHRTLLLFNFLRNIGRRSFIVTYLISRLIKVLLLWNKKLFFLWSIDVLFHCRQMIYSFWNWLSIWAHFLCFYANVEFFLYV